MWKSWTLKTYKKGKIAVRSNTAKTNNLSKKKKNPLQFAWQSLSKIRKRVSKLLEPATVAGGASS